MTRTCHCSALCIGSNLHLPSLDTIAKFFDRHTIPGGLSLIGGYSRSRKG